MSKMREISSIRRGPLYPFLFGCILFFILTSFWNRKKQFENYETETDDDVVVKKEAIQKEAWDTLDGIGYKFAKEKEIEMDPRFEKLNKLSACDLSVDKVPSKIDIPKLMDSFQKCITPIVEKWRGDLKSKEENVMLTLGIGHDTMAEEKLNRTLPNTKFYGADPIIEPNRQLYTAFGKYFPFAIGKNPGFTKFRVLPNQNQKTRKYEFQDVTTIPFTYFLSDILGLKQIDIAWIDIEGGEFEFLDQIHRDGLMDQKGISICQFNLEVHSKFNPPGAQVYHDFIFQVLKEKRYVFLKPAVTDVGVHRMFLINVENEQCVRKFLQ
uniref:Methyltransf_21 domain-containing protein n=1 Tax=Caenorhabditis tropicalis TaxID=1561998 RepID=A0A1I7U2F1_9PELO